jgi:hypothetical protein
MILTGGGRFSWSADSTQFTSATFPASNCSIPPFEYSKRPTRVLGHTVSPVREYHTLTVLPGFQLIVCGGRRSRHTCIRWTKGRATWEMFASLTEERYSHVALGLQDGTILLVGGDGAASEKTSELVPGV